MLGRFNELADAAKTFAGSALTEFSQALNEDEVDPLSSDREEHDDVRPGTPPAAVSQSPASRNFRVAGSVPLLAAFPVEAVASQAGPSHEAVEAMREAHTLEILRLKAVLQAVQEEGETHRRTLELRINEKDLEISSLQTRVEQVERTVETKDAEIENLNSLLGRCVEDKSRLMLEKEETDLLDGKIFRPLFVQLACVRDDATQHLQTLRVLADLLRLSDLDRVTARLPLTAENRQDANNSDSLASQFVNFLNSDLS